MTPLHACLLFSVVLFSVGLAGALSRGNAILVLLGVELMLNAANVNFVAFWRYSPRPDGGEGVMFVIFVIAIAAAEAAVGLALIIAVYRHQRNVRLEEARRLRG